MQNEIRRIESKSLRFMVALMDVYREEGDRELTAFDKLEMDEDITEDFSAMVVAMSILFERVTGFDGDLIDFTHILNKLAVQYVLEKQEGSEDEEDN